MSEETKYDVRRVGGLSKQARANYQSLSGTSATEPHLYSHWTADPTAIYVLRALGFGPERTPREGETVLSAMNGDYSITPPKDGSRQFFVYCTEPAEGKKGAFKLARKEGDLEHIVDEGRCQGLEWETEMFGRKVPMINAEGTLMQYTFFVKGDGVDILPEHATIPSR